MKMLKGLERSERQRRHHLIMEAFERHEAEGLPWMARTSPNDPDIVTEITDNIREPVGVYTWFGKGDWLSISVNQISQSTHGKFTFLEFGSDALNNIVVENEGLRAGDILFKCPPKLVKIYAEIVRDLQISIVSIR